MGRLRSGGTSILKIGRVRLYKEEITCGKSFLMGEWYGPAGADLFFCGLACLALVGRTFFLRQPYPILDYGCMFLEACAGLQYLHLLFCPEVLNRFYPALSEAAPLPERWLNHAL